MRQRALSLAAFHAILYLVNSVKKTVNKLKNS